MLITKTEFHRSFKPVFPRGRHGNRDPRMALVAEIQDLPTRLVVDVGRRHPASTRLDLVNNCRGYIDPTPALSWCHFMIEKPISLEYLGVTGFSERVDFTGSFSTLDKDILMSVHPLGERHPLFHLSNGKLESYSSYGRTCKLIAFEKECKQVVDLIAEAIIELHPLLISPWLWLQREQLIAEEDKAECQKIIDEQNAIQADKDKIIDDCQNSLQGLLAIDVIR